MSRRIKVSELKRMFMEELEDPTDPLTLKVKSKPWDQGEPEGKIEWPKALKMKEAFWSHLKEADPLTPREPLTKLLPKAPQNTLPKVILSRDGKPDLRKLSLNDVAALLKQNKITPEQHDEFVHLWQTNHPYTDQLLCKCPECKKKFDEPFVDPHADPDEAFSVKEFFAHQLPRVKERKRK